MFDGGFTATTLGEKIGTGRFTVNRYLSGARYPTVEYLIKIADCFECTTDYLLGLTDENEKRVFSSPTAFGERFIDLCK
ncbi:MAG: helix-turn-helix transcriptional regulator, partial [Clostridia bacterium]|nr:helix-turn-helix transcriptional regulator [Clostridia bacterium]